MTGVMDLNHILCEPMETKPTNPTILMHSMEYYDGHQQGLRRQRVHSEHYRTSPVLSWGYPLHPYYQRDEVLIPPLTSSLSTNMIPSHSSSSTMSSLSPSTSSSASSLSSSSSSPITPTLATPSLQRRHRSASTSQVYQRTDPLVNPIQTRTPWTPLEDNLLQKGYEQGLSWAMISSTYLPHRSRGCCWGRFKTLQNKNLIDVKTRSSKLAWKTMKVSTSSSSL